MAGLSEFPKEGWAPWGDKEFGEFLAKHFDIEYKDFGSNGYAWNYHSHWRIDTESSKEQFSRNNLRKFYVKDKSEFIPKFPVNSIVRNISDGYAVIPKGWTGEVTGYSLFGNRAYCWGKGNSEKGLNIQFELNTIDLEFVAYDFLQWDRERIKDIKNQSFYSNYAVQGKLPPNIREYPLIPSMCYQTINAPFLESKYFRHTKRSKRFLKKSIKGYVREFTANPCSEIFMGDESGHTNRKQYLLRGKR